MDAFLASLHSEGSLDSSGRFTIDRLRVTELYENAQKLEPCLYFLKAIQAATAAGSARVEVRLLSSAVRVVFFPGRSIADDFHAIFGQEGGKLAEYLRWSVHCAVAAGVGYIQCRLSGPAQADSVEFVFRSQGSTVKPQRQLDPVRRVELSFEGFKATSDVPTFLGIYERIRLHKAITHHCGFGMTPVYIDSFAVGPDFNRLVAPGISLVQKASRVQESRFAILKLARRDARRGRLLVAEHPVKFFPSRVEGRGLAVETASAQRRVFKRNFYLLNAPEDQSGLVWEDVLSLPMFGTRKKGDYRAPGTIKLLAKKSTEAKSIGPLELYQQEFIRHYALSGCQNYMITELDRLVAECLVISSRDRGQGSYLYVLRDGVLLRPMACDLGRADVIGLVADDDVDTDASGLTPIYNDYFESLVQTVRQMIRETRPVC